MNIELLQDHWVNGRKFTPGTILDLPEPAARNLIEAGAALAPDLQTPPRSHRRRPRQADAETPSDTRPETPDSN